MQPSRITLPVSTLLMANVPLLHHKTPPENSELMLLFARICLNSDNFSSLMNTVSWGRGVGYGSSVRIFDSSSSTAKNKINEYKNCRKILCLN